MKLGFALPAIIRSLRYALYRFTGACPWPIVIPLFQNLPSGNRNWPFFAFLDSVAKSSGGRELDEWRRFLRGDAEQFADEFHLGDHISLACPSHPPFSDHVHRLNATQGPPRCPHRSIALR